MSADEQIRYESVQSYIHEISLKEIASVLNRTERQTYPLVAKVRQHALKGVLQGNLGRAPKNKNSDFLKKRNQDIVRTNLFHFNCQHMQERLHKKLRANLTTAIGRCVELPGSPTLSLRR